MATATLEMVKGIFVGAIRDQVAMLRRLGKLPGDGLVVVDCRRILRYDRIRDERLTISGYKNGTKYFERYITINYVNDWLRMVLGCLPVPAGASVPR